MNNRYFLNIIACLFVLFISVLSSCEYISITGPFEFTNGNLLRKQYSATNANIYNQYFYNSSEKIIKIEGYGSTGLERRSEFQYDENNNLVREDVYHTYWGVPENYYAIHKYNNNGLLERSTYYLLLSEGTYEFRSFTTFKYDSNNRIILASLHDTTGIKTQHWEVSYNYIGNVNEIRHFFGEKLIFEDKFEYDDKNNPIKFTNIHLEASNISANNIKKHTQINYNINNSNYTHLYEYEYNVKDYPVSCTCTLDSTKVLYKIFYEYY